ncbi:MAG TPA: hypothetical protein VKP11_03875, partial [Frankiaceae bacterium]|nr:hypothetical protein [Frankiaceae bacterium]
MRVDRPTFDLVPDGYDRHQVDAYVAGLWRYARELAVRAAVAEAALAEEGQRRPADPAGPADVGGRIGRMLQLAAEEAALIRLTARQVAEQALAGAVERAAENSPIVREAREQADRLLMDAQEEANRWARRREQEAEARVARAAVAVEELHRRQAGVLRWLRRVRELLEDRDLDQALAGPPGRPVGPDTWWPGRGDASPAWTTPIWTPIRRMSGRPRPGSHRPTRAGSTGTTPRSSTPRSSTPRSSR